jgi:hypothetical protein
MNELQIIFMFVVSLITFWYFVWRIADILSSIDRNMRLKRSADEQRTLELARIERRLDELVRNQERRVQSLRDIAKESTWKLPGGRV